MDGAYKEKGRWEGGGGCWERLGKPKAGSPCHWATHSGAVPSADNRNVHKPQDESKRPLVAVWHHPILISAPSWPTGPIMHQPSFIGSAKSCL